MADPPAIPISRQRQLESLRSFVVEVKAGHGRGILVEGEPGIGKTSLVRVVANEARNDELRVLWAVCDELSQAFPMLPLLEALDGCGDETRAARTTIADLLRGDPGVGSRNPVIPAAIERFLALTERLCADGPVVLVVDDLQWADAATVVTLGRLVRGLDQLPLLLVGLARTVPRRDDVVAFRRAVEPHIVRMRNLCADEVAAFVADVVQGTPGPRLLERAQGAAGNPLYLTELIDVLVRADALRRTGDVVEADAATAPGSLSAAISDRLAFLSPPAREVLRIAALLGIDFSVRELSVVAGRRLPDLLPIIDEAILAGVVLDSGNEMAFRHPLIRDSLYDGMPAAVRVAWHRDAAKALADAGAPAERVARQLRPTIEADEASVDLEPWVVAWLTESAPQLIGQAPKVAIPMLRWALNGTPPGATAHDVLASKLADALYRQGELAAACEVASAALVHVKRPDMIVELHQTLMQCNVATGRHQETLGPLRRALDMPGIQAQHRGRLLVLIARTQRELGLVDDAARMADEALHTATSVGDHWCMGWALFVQIMLHGMRGEATLALPLYDQALAVSEGDPTLADLRLLLQINQSMALGVLDRYDEAIRVAEQVRVSADQAGNIARFAQAQSALGELLYDTGRWDDALTEIDVALGVSKNPVVSCIEHAFAAIIQLHRGGADGDAHLCAANEAYKQLGGRPIPGGLALARSLRLELDDDLAGALEVLLGSLSEVQDDEEVVELLADAVRLAVATDDKALAGSIVERAEDMAAGQAAPHRRAVLLHCQSLLAGDPAGLLEAANGYRAASRPLPRAQALEAAALLLAERGEAAEARNLFTDAYTLYSKLGAEWDLARTQATFRSYGIRRGPRVRHRQARRGWEALTPTEIRVAGMVAQGMSNPQIAAQLYLSRRTVQTHVSHILAKLELQSRIDIAREASQRELTQAADN